MIAIVAAVLLLAAPVAPDAEAIARQQAVVTELARAAAAARDAMVPRDRVAQAMAAYRVEAERLATARDRAARLRRDEEAVARVAALQGIEGALASGRRATASRRVLQEWLGPEDGWMATLDAVLASVRSNPESPLAADLLLDVAERAAVIVLVSAYDASRAKLDADAAALRARSLRARAASGMSGGIEQVLQARSLEALAAEQREVSLRAEERRARAADLQAEAFALMGEH